jgi:hypothetical protein
MTIIAELMTYVNDLRQIGAFSTNKTGHGHHYTQASINNVNKT